YQKTLNLTGTILKESAQLIWLIICSVFVFGAWFSDTAVKTGKGIRDWVDNQGAGGPDAGESKPIGETGKELLDTGLTGVNYLLNQAREQLGLEAQERPAKPPAASSAPPAPKATPVAAPSVPAKAPAQTPTPKATPAPSAASAPMADSEITREPAEDGWGSGNDDV
ncbi:MAG: hypothetical protein AAFP03_04075, partial [Cyanobacteria bacterium J06598_3]